MNSFFFSTAVLKKPAANEGTCIIQSTNTKQCYMGLLAVTQPSVKMIPSR